jgi:hypothetical protein
LLEWSAAVDADVWDRDVWRAATPVPIDGVREALMVDELAADEFTFRFERLNRWPAGAGLSWGERVAGMLPAARPAVWVGPVVGALESAPDGSSWGAAVSDGIHVECRQWPEVGGALGWLRGLAPGRVLAHDAVVKQLGEVGLPLVRVSVSDTAAGTATLRDAAPGLSWSGVLRDQLLQADVSLVGGKQVLDSAGAKGPLSALKCAAWALWAARAVPVEFAAVF